MSGDNLTYKTQNKDPFTNLHKIKNQPHREECEILHWLIQSKMYIVEMTVSDTQNQYHHLSTVNWPRRPDTCTMLYLCNQYHFMV